MRSIGRNLVLEFVMGHASCWSRTPPALTGVRAGVAAALASGVRAGGSPLGGPVGVYYSTLPPHTGGVFLGGEPPDLAVGVLLLRPPAANRIFGAGARVAASIARPPLWGGVPSFTTLRPCHPFAMRGTRGGGGRPVDHDRRCIRPGRRHATDAVVGTGGHGRPAAMVALKRRHPSNQAAVWSLVVVRTGTPQAQPSARSRQADEENPDAEQKEYGAVQTPAGTL